MNTTRIIEKSVTRTVIVLESSIYADGKLQQAGDVLEVDAGTAQGMIVGKRARRATAEEAAGTGVVITKSWSNAA